MTSRNLSLTLEAATYLAILLLLLCSPAVSWSQSQFDSDARRADTHRRADAMVEGDVQSCTVLAIRSVTLEVGNTAKFAATTIGGLLGAAIASRSSSGYAAPLLGTAVGGLAGHAAAQTIGSDRAHEIVMECAGRAVAVVQQADEAAVPAVGARVKLIRLGGRTRVVA